MAGSHRDLAFARCLRKEAASSDQLVSDLSSDDDEPGAMPLVAPARGMCAFPLPPASQHILAVMLSTAKTTSAQNPRQRARRTMVADGLPLFVRQDGTPRPRATVRDGVALREARRRKERVYPELTRVGGRARLVVIAGEVGGRRSSETAHYLSSSSPRAHGLETEMGEYF